MWQKMSWVIAITAGVVAAVLTDAPSSPAVIGDHGVPHWAGMRSILFIHKRQTFLTQKEMSLNTGLTERHP